MSQKLNRQAREKTVHNMRGWTDYGSVSLLEAARKHAAKIADTEYSYDLTIPIEVRCETSPEIQPAVFNVKVELVATVLDPRGQTDKEENQEKQQDLIDANYWAEAFSTQQPSGVYKSFREYRDDLAEKLESAINPGPQRGPSSSAKIQAEQKATINALKALRELCCEKFDDHQKRYNVTKSVRNMGYHDGAMGAFNMVAKSLEPLITEVKEDDE